MRNKVRRRNSNGSAASVKQASDTVHPRKMRCSVDGSALSRNIEDMMKIIAAQGRVISEELDRMNATTSQQQQPRNLASRSYDAGLNRSASSTSAAAMRSSLERPMRKRERSEPALNQRQANSSAEEQTDIEQVRDYSYIVINQTTTYTITSFVSNLRTYK